MASSTQRRLDFEITRAVRDHGPISRAEVARLLEMSPSTVGREVDDLLSLGLLQETGQKQGDGAGRPSIMLEFNPKINSVLTVDLRLTRAYAAITDLAGNILSTELQSLTVADPQRSTDELIDLIRRLLLSAKHLPPVGALVIGAPSIVDVEKGLIEWAPSLNWSEVPLKQILESKFATVVLVENDVNLAALGEYWKGAGRSVKNNMVFVSIGTGIGAGIILNRELYRGATHAAGEVAYFITDLNVLRDNVGRIGNLENRVGHEGLIRMAQLVAQRYPASLLAKLLSQNRKNVRTQEILALADQEDEAALLVFNELIDALTIVICNASVLLDPEMIVLSGPSDWRWNKLIPAIQNRIGSALLRQVNLMPSLLGNNALILGGSYSALEVLPIISDTLPQVQAF
jgi:predicted NBD/HSP70 family sugar kinase